MGKIGKLTFEEAEEVGAFLNDSSNDSTEIKRAQAILMLNDGMDSYII